MKDLIKKNAKALNAMNQALKFLNENKNAQSYMGSFEIKNHKETYVFYFTLERCKFTDCLDLEISNLVFNKINFKEVQIKDILKNFTNALIHILSNKNLLDEKYYNQKI